MIEQLQRELAKATGKKYVSQNKSGASPPKNQPNPYNRGQTYLNDSINQRSDFGTNELPPKSDNGKDDPEDAFWY